MSSPVAYVSRVEILKTLYSWTYHYSCYSSEGQEIARYMDSFDDFLRPRREDAVTEVMRRLARKNIPLDPAEIRLLGEAE